MQNLSFDWALARESLRNRLGSEVVSRWLDPLSVTSVSEQSLILEAPNPFFLDWINTHYLEAIQSLAGGRAVQLVSSSALDDSASAPLTETIKVPATTIPVPSTASGQRPASLADEKSPQAPLSESSSAERQDLRWGNSLNPKFTFDRFVVGPSNRFAHAASLAVAESPAKAYNPLFIYGAVGLGKTHLMQAVGHAILERAPRRRIVYASSEGFTNELITAIQTKSTVKFRERYRTVDVLLVDDIHFIAGKEATQEEFFHTFNTLYDAHKQIVMSSDRSPKEIAGLEERLVSRFEWGLVTDIQAPDLETRMAILRKKAEEAGIAVADEVSFFIAKQITSNIRELEGALIRVVAYCQFSECQQTVDIAKNVLKDMVREVSSRITIGMIQNRVADYFKIESTEMRGSKRHRSILHPRQIAMYLCRKLTEASLPEIGRAFGGKDHTTVLHAVAKIEKELAQDVHRKHTLDQLSQSILQSSQQDT